MWKGAGQGWKHLRAGWARCAHAIGNFQARLLLLLLYALFVLPLGIIVRVFADLLRTKRRPTRWLDRPDEANDLQWARKQ